METKFFHHALRVLENQCIGCTHCMKVCPTGAIRVIEGLARINDNRCVDCGMCLRSCPVKAIIVEQDDFSRIFKYKHRVALIPAVLIGQFPEEVPTPLITSILFELGFNKVVEVETGVGLLKEAMEQYLADDTHPRPLISSFCPAIVRLIQVRFPALVDNIMLLKPPLDITALAIREELHKTGATDDEIGIFYVTPCAAKIAAIKSPVGEKESPVTGVINMDTMYNKIYRVIKAGKEDHCVVPENEPLEKFAIRWTLTHGEANNFEGRCLAIDEIHNVIDFLEKIENEDITNIDFLELRACDQSCAGGVLVQGNRFLVRERLRKRARKESRKNNSGFSPLITANESFLREHLGLEKLEPRPLVHLTGEPADALKKMEISKMALKCLPHLDCGACGTPSCEFLANDIAMGIGSIRQCFYISRLLEKQQVLNPDEAFHTLCHIWGENKIREERWNANFHHLNELIEKEHKLNKSNDDESKRIG